MPAPTLTVVQLRRFLVTNWDDLPVRLIVNGIAYPVTDVWVEPRQEGGEGPAFCIGEDPR